jgi:protein O-GlcNAc transferase
MTAPFSSPAHQDAIRKAVKLARSGRTRALRTFCAKACRQFPESLELAKLHFMVCREQGESAVAAKVALEFLDASPGSLEVYGWLESVLSDVTKRDLALLKMLSRMDSRRGHELKVQALVSSRNSVEARCTFDSLQQRWPGESLLTPIRFGDLLFEHELYEEAERVYWNALEQDAGNPRLIRRSIENLLHLTQRVYPEKMGEAQELSRTFLADQPDEPEAWYAAGLVWRAAYRPSLAYYYFKRYFELHTEHPFRSAHVFDAGYVEGLAAAELYQLRRDWSEVTARLTRVVAEPPANSLQAGRRLRVGYVSPDFGCHPVGYFAKTVLFEHTAAVEVFLYSQRDPVGENDSMSREFRSRVGDSHWRWINLDRPDRLLERVRADRIDILIDLAGHSKGNRLDVFCNRAAPVQVSWLGYPATSGVVEMDYRFSDEIVEPAHLGDQWSTEKIWRLPNGFHALAMPAGLPEPVAPPCLQHGYITFGSFNNINKMGPETCALWARVLREIPQARLLLKHKTMEIFANRESLRSLFVLNGVDPTRISFKGVTEQRDDHFAYYGMMDVALDPVGYNGTTTTCEALYMGVPVLTCPGNSHASRVSSSLLQRMGLAGWVASDADHFVRIAKAAAAKPEALAARRARMRTDYNSSPLNDGAGLARDMETAYAEMWQTHCAANTSGI